MDNKEEVKENKILTDLENNMVNNLVDEQAVRETKRVTDLDYQRSLLEYKRSKLIIDDLEDCASDRKILIKHSKRNIRNYVFANVLNILIMSLFCYAIFTKV